MSAWLSILIPVYNVEKYIVECLESIATQQLDGVEVILLNDCATDNSEAIIQQYRETSALNFSLLTHQKNAGLSAARNSLIKVAKGDYLWFLDSDDCLENGAVAELKSIIEQQAPDMVLCDYRVWRPDDTNLSKQFTLVHTFAGKEQVLLNSKSDLFQGLYEKGKLHAWSKIAKREYWANLSFPEGKYFEDMVTTPRLSLQINTYYYAKQSWIKYRQRESSILAIPSMQKVTDMMEGNLDVLAEWRLGCPDLSKAAQFAFIRYCVKVYFFTRRQLRKLGLDNRSQFGLFRNILFRSTQTSLFGLIGWYLARGQIFRLLKLLSKL